ncbi:valine--tRNA ligase [Candidatus Uhrbacteria bacterium]|nr:valine--tRNA ligase [Candidatus Uhrbacteria bacterium]
MQLSKAYNPSEHEDGIYQLWELSGAFNPDNLPAGKESFSIAMPPPNATGTLHVGHAMMLVLQDVMTRYHRMKGDTTLWLPGTDHASIATQNKVEKILAHEGVTRQDLGREAFLERVSAYVSSSQQTIRTQMRKMGASCDWSRERYTMDEGLSAAVSEMFVRMYQDGLIYRGNRMVNWCPRCQSTLSDDEVTYTPEKTNFYYLKYGPVIIGTARPETKFLDNTIVVNPHDARYIDLLGKEMDVEWINGTIRAQVLGDDAADKDFGTGAMTITPAHSFEDFDLATRYKLPVVKIIDEQGNLTNAAGPFSGKNARSSRKAIVALLSKKGLLDHVDEQYEHNLSICYRCQTALEPMPSLQWFVDVNKKIKKYGSSLKELMADSVATKKIKIVPERFEKVYFHWIDSLRDWCISRQIWFGHRLPVYYCASDGCGQVHVSVHAPTACTACSKTSFIQESDTLDTWFSSGLWTFSTLGWPTSAKSGLLGGVKKSGDLARFHPTSVMETGYDILFFWVGRMILMSRYALGEIPFKTVYLHGLVLDLNRKKMSKSNEETLIDPLDVIPKYGTDALRLSMIVGTTPGNDLLLNEEKIASYRNFVNKLWNISRFILADIEALEREVPKKEKKSKPTLADRWIQSRLLETALRVSKNIAAFQFSHAAEELRRFTWDDLADWYLEIAKIEKGKSSILKRLLQSILVLWHPFMPFVTERLYQHAKDHFGKACPSMLMIHPWLFGAALAKDDTAEKDFSALQTVIQTIRNARSENGIRSSQYIQAVFYAELRAVLLQEQTDVIKKLCKIDVMAVLSRQEKKPHDALYFKVEDIEIYLPLGMMKTEEERARLEKDATELEKRIQDLRARLSDQDFLARAPKAVIEREQEKMENYISTAAKIEEQLMKLKNL